MVVLLIILIVILISFTTSTIVLAANGNQTLSFILLGFNLLFSIPTIFTIVLNVRHSETARKNISNIRYNYGEKKFNEFVNKNSLTVYNNFKILIDDQPHFIQHFLVSNKGIFIINVVSQVGTIIGEINSKKWNVVLEKEKIKKEIDNPLYLSQIALSSVKSLLNLRSNVFTIAFIYGGSFKTIKDVHVMKLKTFIKMYNKLSKVYKNEEIDELNNFIIQYLSKPIYSYKEKLENLICPDCGSKLHFRHTKNGDYLKCSQAPKCKFFLKL